MSIDVVKQNPIANWKWYLARPIYNSSTRAFESFERIGLLSAATSKTINLSLNSAESASFSINTHDPLAPFIEVIKTCIVCYRNGEIKWSGMVWTINEEVADGKEEVNVSCVGWFQKLSKRFLRTGAKEHGIEEGSILHGVGPTATTDALSQTYFEVEPENIAKDLLERTNFEWPTGIVPGTIEAQPEGIKWKATYQQFQNIGQAIAGLANIENGFDFRVNPETLALDIFYKRIRKESNVFGRGADKPNVVFGYHWGPSNLVSLKRTIDGSKLLNQDTVLGQFGSITEVFGSHSNKSIEEYGLWQNQETIATIIGESALEFLALIEVLTLEHPLPIYTFSPMAASESVNTPQPFVEYDIGDFVYLGAEYGRMVINHAIDGTPINGPQPMRVFAFTINIDENGNEIVSNIQTTYQGTKSE